MMVRGHTRLRHRPASLEAPSDTGRFYSHQLRQGHGRPKRSAISTALSPRLATRLASRRIRALCGRGIFGFEIPRTPKSHLHAAAAPTIVEPAAESTEEDEMSSNAPPITQQEREQVERASTTTASISPREKQEIEAANASGNTPVVFIHGLWLLPSSWSNWADLF